MQKNLQDLENFLRINFKNKDLLQQALTHSSYCIVKKQSYLNSNERLEFLGDAVLKIVISDFLFKKFPEAKEGYLSKIRANIVSDKSLAEIALNLKLGDYLFLSNAEEADFGRAKKSNLSGALEALFGAYHIDQNDFFATYDFVLNIMQEKADTTVNTKDSLMDSKTALQEYTQKNSLKMPKYELIKTIGPEHKKIFLVRLSIEAQKGNYVFEAKGKTKKEAEQKVASIMLKKMKL